MTKRPQNPDPKGTPEERLAGWRAIKNWAIDLIASSRKALKRQRRLVRIARRRIKMYTGSTGLADFGGRCTNLTPEVKKIVSLANAQGLYVTSTCDGVPGDGRHTASSLHYPQNNGDGKGHAVDIAGSWTAMIDFQNWLVDKYGHGAFQELFGPDNSSSANAKNGVALPMAEGSGLEQLHDTHIHVAPYKGSIPVGDKKKLAIWRKKLAIRQKWGEELRDNIDEGRKTRDKAQERIDKVKEQLEPKTISDEGIVFISNWEGWLNKPYNDPVGHCTIGFGHLLHRGPCTSADYDEWGTISKKKGYQLLRADTKFAGDAVVKLVKVKLNQDQFDALTSFTFNCGVGALTSSTLLKKLNAGDYKGAADELPKWVYADGQKLPGLVRRREAERKLFLGQS